MNATLTAVLVVCLVLITLTNLFLTVAVTVILFRAKKVLDTAEKFVKILNVIGSGWAKVAGVLAAAAMGFLSKTKAASKKE
ncbi:MAG: hypothetical protein ABIJ11_01580 [Elusimicrobiota bacterium]